jgi:hydrogenase 3 maturation protease
MEQKPLVMDLEKLLRNHRRVAIVGIGNEERGDDAAGLEIVKRLQIELPQRGDDLLFLCTGTVPENFTREIVSFKPELVVLVDAADFGGKPGELVLAAPDAVRGIAFSTHTLPLSVLATYIERMTGARVVVLGIQPKNTDASSGPSPEVERTVRELVKRIACLLSAQRP